MFRMVSNMDMDMDKIKKNKKQKEDNAELQAVWIAAGTAAFMACLKRALLVSFVQQWRVWVFLALNLLLLAILVTSTRFSSPSTSPKINGNGPPESKASSAPAEISNENKKKKTKRRKLQLCTKRSMLENGYCELSYDDVKSHEISSSSRSDYQEIGEENNQLSKEELNQRVEAFIAMFRQHLASDAKASMCPTNACPCAEAAE